MSEHELWNELGNLYFLAGAYNQAVHAYERSIQADTNFGRPYSNLALTYVQQGKYDEAIDLYRRSIELLAEDKERAISWNRLGTVYRHLKDYSRAVIAFQEADLLDPHSADEFPASTEAKQQASEPPSSVLDDPVGEPERNDVIEEAELPVVEPESEALAAELPLEEAQPVVSAVLTIEEPEAVAEYDASGEEPEQETAAEEEYDPDPEIEWWDIDEARMQAAVTGQPAASIAADDPNASWTPADPSQFQQDLSQMPETGSLTTWGDADFDDDFELFPGAGADPEQELPDPDGDRIATWIPLPEEAPLNLDEVWLPPFVEEEQPEPDFPLEWNEAPAYHVLNSIDFGPVLPPTPSAPEPMEYLQRSELLPVRQQGAVQQSWDQLDVDVAVEERPSDIALGTQESPRPPEPLTVQEVLEQNPPEPELPLVQEVLEQNPPETQLPLVQEVLEEQDAPEPEPEPSMNVLPPDLPDCERDEEEIHEIEMGIAKFRRVVQVNPRNAHAWDALGTLYKSAGLYKDAILAYQQAICNDASKSLYYHHLGLVYACEGRDEDAISAFQRVLEIDPDYGLAHATLGGYYRKMGLEELAQKHIGKAMKSIFDSENEYNRACLEAICGNADQAIELLGVALKNKQTYVDWILRDPDLDFIRQDPRFKQLISDYTR